MAIGLVVLYSSCTQKIYKEYNLFQKGLDSIKNFEYKAPIIQNGDNLSVQISSATPSQDQVAVFNLSNSNNGVQNSLVDLNGNINLPIIGQITSTGKTTNQVEVDIKNKLDPYVKDPIVIVRLASFKVNILGEVVTQGLKTFNTNTPTIIDALSAAGGFTDRATRNHIYLIRDVNGVRNTYSFNLNDASVFNAVGFQLVQNDLIYVPSDEVKLKTVNQDVDLPKRIQIAQIALAAISAVSVILNTYLIFRKL